MSFSIAARNNDVDVDADDDDNIFMKNSKSSKDNTKKIERSEHTDSIVVKAGRNTSNTLYYMNQSRLENDGNGIKPERKNALVASVQTGKEETSVKVHLIRAIHDNIAILSHEPLNQELKEQLPLEEELVQQLQNDVINARKFKVNETKAKSFKRKIESGSNEWRNRKRLCIDFLNQMEDWTEGVVATKKCLSGSGQIEIESDEVVVKQAKEMHRYQRNNIRQGNHKSIRSNESQTACSFVAVMLGIDGKVQRVHYNA